MADKTNKRYRLWSNCQGKWWRPNGAGHTPHIEEAGIYTYAAAELRHGKDHRPLCACDKRMLADVAIPAPDHNPGRKA